MLPPTRPPPERTINGERRSSTRIAGRFRIGHTPRHVLRLLARSALVAVGGGRDRHQGDSLVRARRSAAPGAGPLHRLRGLDPRSPKRGATDPRRLRSLHVRWYGQSALRPEQRAALGTVDVLFVPAGGGPTISATDAAQLVRDVAPGLIVSMHFRTALIGFLDAPDAFLEALGMKVDRLPGNELVA